MTTLEDEMSRFEQEISGNRGFLGHDAYAYSAQLPQFGNVPPPPPPPPLLIPHVMRNGTTKRGHFIPSHYTNPHIYSEPIIQPAVVSADPKIYTSKPVLTSPMESQAIDITALQVNETIAEVGRNLQKRKSEKVSVAAEVAISQGKASSALQSFRPNDYKRRGKNPKLMRTAGGQTWEDNSMADWEEDDFRIFCGDLGNDVTDELLTRTFNKFPSFLRAKVIREKRTSKSKGFGFVSFKDPSDFIKAMKEMNGRYVGSRPIKLRKSSWKNRNIDIVKKKEKEKIALLNVLTAGSGR